MKQYLNLCFVLILITGLKAQETETDTTRVETLDEVLIKAIRVDADSPITHSNMNKEEIQQRNIGQDIPVLLNYLPSVVTTTDAGAGIGYTYIRVRGSDASRVNITINGIPFNDSESQGTFWVNLPDFASSIESLQLQRGVGSSTNGSGAFGASLNILSNAISEEAFIEINNSYGSYETWKQNIQFGTGLLGDHFELSGRLSNITSDGYIDRAFSDLKSYYLQMNYINDNTLVKGLMFGGKEITYQAWYGVDEETLKTNRTFNPAGIYTDADGAIQFYDNEVDNYQQDHYQLHWNQRFNNNWSTNLGMNYTYGRGYFEQYKEDQDFDFYGLDPIEIGDESISVTDLIRRRWLDNDFYVINAHVNYNRNHLDITTGAYYSHYDGDHFGEVIWSQFASNSSIRDRYYEGNGKKNEFTLFSKATYRINEKWSVYGDLQGRFVNYTTTGLTSDKIPLVVDENYSFFNPKAGITFEMNTSNQWYASYGKGHREPRRSDFENGVNNPEVLDDLELGWRFNQGKTQLNVNLFYMDYKDQLVLTGELDDVGAPIRTTSGKSYRFGLEIDASLNLARGLKILPNFTWSTNKNIDFVTSKDGSLVDLGNTDISFSPSFIAGNIIEYQLFKDFRISMLSKFVGEQYMGNIDSKKSKLDSYFIHDLNIAYTIKKVPYINEILITGLVNNLFNKEYVSNGYFYTYDDDFSEPGTVTTVEGAGYYPQATTNFLLGVTIKI
jgi:iron complex outermembrane receptor protein